MVSVVVGTRNRAVSLHHALQSLVSQAGDVPFEVVVVDNASTDDTPLVVERFRDGVRPVRYCIESRDGVAFARNSGAACARAALVAFMDDDQIAHPGWVAAIVREFAAHPDVQFLGGRNLPPPGTRLPSWVTAELTGALSLLDRGDCPQPIDAAHWMTLAGGNMACRREAFDAVGGFKAYARSQDRELTLRLLSFKYRGRYVPDMVMYHPVERSRLTRRHFRRWHAMEGRMRAHYRFLERFDRGGRLLPAPPHGRHLFGVSLFVYRQCLAEAAAWGAALARGRGSDAFHHELKARHIFHYIVSAARGARELPATPEGPRAFVPTRSPAPSGIRVTR